MTQDNRRRFIRHPAGLPIRYRPRRSPDCTRSTLRNVSRGGLCFACEQALDPGALLEVSVPTPFGVERFDAQVAWCRVEGGERMTGVCFFGEADAHRARLVAQVCMIEAYRRDQRSHGRLVDHEAAAREWVRQYAHTVPYIA